MAGRISYLGGIVTQGLVLDLDAAKRDSYAGTGTAWNDISGNRNNGTLINGPTFNPGNGGSIVFDGSNDYYLGNFSSIINNTTTGTSPIFTISNWIFLTANSGIIDGLGRVSPSEAQSWAHYYQYTNPSGPTINFNKVNSGISNIRTFQVVSQANVILPNRWNNIVTIYNSGTVLFYLNGSQITNSITANDGSTTIVNNNFSLIFGKSNLGSGGESLNGRIANYIIYNRALSASEILQNYNATKGRYL
jgi:hypothetical protein